MVVISRTAWFICGKNVNIHIICTFVWHENCLVQLHLKSKLHFGRIETAFGYLQATCTTFCICILHALNSVSINCMCAVYFLFITVSSFFCYFNRLNSTGKYTNRHNIMKISVISKSVHLFFV
jgi:hypothetical protein